MPSPSAIVKASIPGAPKPAPRMDSMRPANEILDRIGSLMEEVESIRTSGNLSCVHIVAQNEIRRRLHTIHGDLRGIRTLLKR